MARVRDRLNRRIVLLVQLGGTSERYAGWLGLLLEDCVELLLAPRPRVNTQSCSLLHVCRQLRTTDLHSVLLWMGDAHSIVMVEIAKRRRNGQFGGQIWLGWLGL